MGAVKLPAVIEIDRITEGDSWQGLSVGPVTFDGEAWPVALETVRMKVRRRDTKAVVLSFTSAGGSGTLPVTITDADTWEFEVPEVAKESLTGLTAGVHEWDMDVTDAEGFRLTIYEGTWTVREKVD